MANVLRLTGSARPLLVLVLILLPALALAGPASRVQGATDCWTADPALDPEEVGFYLLINQYRADNGLGPLGISTNLTRAAAWFARDLGQRAYFSHTDSSGRSPSQRSADCGYGYGAGENIAAGTERSTGLAAFEAWRASPPHDANMLEPRYVQIGIARAFVAGSPYGWYWVTDFGVTADGTDGSDIRIASPGSVQRDCSRASGTWRPRSRAACGWRTSRASPPGTRCRTATGSSGGPGTSSPGGQPWVCCPLA